MNALDIARYRLHNQYIARQRFDGPDQVVAWLGAMQAQDYAGAKWSVGLRLPNGTDGEIEHALADRTIIRTWPMRGTLHFVPATDIYWMLELLTPRVIARATTMYRTLGLDDALFTRGHAALEGAMIGGKQLSRLEVNAVFEQSGIPVKFSRHILQHAAMRRLICFGALRGKQHVFTLLQEWAPRTTTLERDLALGELARRYFQSHGPATLRDFCWWSGLTAGDARAGLEAAKPVLIPADVDGQTYWMPASLPDTVGATSDVYLLSGFDEYLLGYADRGAVLDPQYVRKIVTGANGVFNPTVILDGKVEGVWRRTICKGRVAISPVAFTSWSEAQQRGIAAAAERYGSFLGMPVQIIGEGGS